MLLVPRVCYGTLKDVKKASSKVIKTLFKTENAEEAFASEGFVDVQEVRRPLVMHSHKGDGTEAVFPGNPLLLYSEKRYDKYGFKEELAEADRRLIKQLCQTDWGTLALTSQDAVWLFWNFTKPLKQGKEPDPIIYTYLAAAVKYWDVYEDIGQNFFFGSNAEYLWDLPNSLNYVLANLGVPNKIFESPLPEGGLASVIPDKVMKEIQAQ